MKEITSLQNLINLLDSNYEGIIVGVPTVPLRYSAELFILKDRDTFSGYNKEDGTYNGFSKDCDSRISIADWRCDIKYYHFENLTDFCEWYLHKDDKLKEDIDEFVEETNGFYGQMGDSFWSSNKSKEKAREELHKINIEMIQDEMNEDLHLCSHTLPSGTTIMWAGENEFHPIKKQTRKEQLKDVIKFFQMNNEILELQRLQREYPSSANWKKVDEVISKLNDWLEEEV